MSSKTSTLPFSYHPAAERMPAEERERLLANPGFGRVFTEHMVGAHWTPEGGWRDAGLVPYSKLE
ncbi:MAG TPA: branched chain amino acid aminotransferase, partial [Candidatus Dormibacteraeota bacterium]